MSALLIIGHLRAALSSEKVAGPGQRLDALGL